ncbi:uncharacterized protein LOC118466823 isoform X1 [Anopheles albimanus]|uniref:uncharacterized protein LOC118466823 isoform X1 n=1 Tax=Anopheles albimanus TaxID=7167 RepID=UPI001641CE37|nr:uncharacterized protein LOC118466823 isoform X1 [Anopheles albimanus]
MSTNSGGGGGENFPTIVAVSNYHDIYVQQQSRNEGLDSTNTATTTTAPPERAGPANARTMVVAIPPPTSQQPGASSSGTARIGVYPTTAGPPTLLAPAANDLPSYEEAVNIEGPPPSYDSLYEVAREVHKTSLGVLDFVKNIVILVLGTLGCTIILGITIVIPVCMLVFGTVYLYDCPQGEYIPVYLLVGGGFGVLKQLLHLSTRVRSREEQELERLRQTPTQTLINCFMLGWFIIGSFWIYRIYEPNYDPALGKYCNKSLYLFTFWLITSVYMMLGIVTVVLCSVSIISLIFHRHS